MTDLTCQRCNGATGKLFAIVIRHKGGVKHLSVCLSCRIHCEKKLKTFQTEEEWKENKKRARELERSSQTAWFKPRNGATQMPRVALRERKFRPYWGIPKGSDGLFGWMTGQIVEAITMKKKTYGDKSWEQLTCVVRTSVEVNGKLVENIEFNFEDGSANVALQGVQDMYPRDKPVPGKSPSPPKEVKKFIGVVYLRCNEKGYHTPEVFISDTAEGLLAEMNAECLPLYHGLQQQFATEQGEEAELFPGWTQLDSWHQSLSDQMAEFAERTGQQPGDNIPF